MENLQVVTLSESLKAWGSDGFKDALKNEMAQLNVEQLPLAADHPALQAALQQGLKYSSHAVYDAPGVVILSVTEYDDHIRVKAGVFYSGIISGCSCADDPTPTDMVPEYCELQLDINKATANTSVFLLQN